MTQRRSRDPTLSRVATSAPELASWFVMSSQAVRALLKQLAIVRRMIRTKELMYVFVEPDAEKVTQWHFLFEGPPETPYAGGFYHGALVVISAQIFGHVLHRPVALAFYARPARAGSEVGSGLGSGCKRYPVVHGRVPEPPAIDHNDDRVRPLRSEFLFVRLPALGPSCG